SPDAPCPTRRRLGARVRGENGERRPRSAFVKLIAVTDGATGDVVGALRWRSGHDPPGPRESVLGNRLFCTLCHGIGGAASHGMMCAPSNSESTKAVHVSRTPIFPSEPAVQPMLIGAMLVPTVKLPVSRLITS